jgi:glycerophosphoryl diester phosphodiesterase
VVAHRGVHGPGAPENTIAAFAAAAAAGAEMVELDVRRAGDGELVVFHDPTCGEAPVSTLSHAQLQEAAGLEVPLLADALAWARGRIALDVELKEDGYVEEVSAQLLDFQRQDGELLVSSFLERVLAQLGAGLRKGLLLSSTARAAGARAQQCGAHALVVELGLLSDAVRRDAATHGLDLYVWDYLAERDGPGPARDPRIAGVITDDVPAALVARAAASISR